MIVSECKAVRTLLEQVREANQNKHLVESIESRRHDLVEVAAAIAESSSVLALLMDRAIVAPARVPDGRRSLERCVEMRGILKVKPAEVSKGRKFTDLRTAFQKLAEQFSKVGKDAWNEYVERNRPKPDRNQLAQGRQLGHGDVVDDIERLESDLRQSTRTPPRTVESLDCLEAQWESLRKAMGQLPALSVDPDVKAFLKAADGRDGARLEMLTPGVLEWLQEEDMLDHFCIVRA